MSVYIQCTTDAFEETRAAASKRRFSPYNNVRRPLRGIQVKENTYATLRVKTASGDDLNLFNSSASAQDSMAGVGRSAEYCNFLMQSYQEQRAEKQQIIQTFGEDYIYFFGEQPRFIAVSGTLINTKDFNWKSEFWTNYDEVLRGTKLVERNARLYFYFDDVVIEGYMVNAAATAESMNPHMMPFQFQIFITNYAILSDVGSVFIEGSSSGARGKSALEPILPAGNVPPFAGSGGGLTGFLASTAKFANNATFAIQSALEEARSFYLQRALVVPGDLIDTAISPIVNQGQWEAPRTGVPIHEMTDEYVERAPSDLDTGARSRFANEQLRIDAQLAMRNPVALEAKARATFKEAGISTEAPSAMAAILGRGAFAAVQYAAPFALSKISGGTIGIADQASQAVL